MSIPIQELTVVYRQAEHRRWHRFCFILSYCVATPIGCFYKMAQVKIMNDNLASLCSDLAQSSCL